MGQNDKTDERPFAWLIGEFGVLLHKRLTINNLGGWKDANVPTGLWGSIMDIYYPSSLLLFILHI